MNKLLLATALLATGVTAYAQDWKAGDEITDKVNWSNLKFESDDFTPWMLTSSKGSFTKSGGLFEVYDGADVDLYQVVELKAGEYRLECQAYYRFGNSWSEDPSKFGTDDWQDLAQLYVQNGTYDITSQEFFASRTFQSPVMPRLYEQYGQKIYTMPEGEASWDMSDGSYGEVWGPCSVPGSLAWFNSGHYYPDAEKTYNSVSFFVAKDGYVKVGITKKEAKEADSFMATNFKLFYEGEVSADREFEILQDEVEIAKQQATALSEEIFDYYQGLYSCLSDAIMETENEEDKSTEEGCKKSIDAYNQLVVDYKKYYAEAQTLTALIAKCEGLLGTSEDAAFIKAIEDAKAVEQDGNAEGSEVTIDDPTAYGKAADALSAARATFIKDFKNEDGSVEVTSYIAYPWFCLPEYEPTWDAENNCWVPNEKALATPFDGTTVGDDGELVTWNSKDDCDGTANNIAKGVSVNGKESETGVWYQHGGGGNLVVYWNDKLTCIKKWSLVSEDYHDVSQRLAGIPNGYYKLKALAQTWSNDWSNNCENHIYIQSTAMESHSANLTPGGWWGTDINQWVELETDMILVNDGEVIISSRDNGFAAFTGFRLFYFGETPDFNKLLAPQIAEIKAANEVENGLWEGDVKAVNAILAKIPADIQTEEQFSIASETINEAKAYISTAKSAIATFNENTFKNFNDLSSVYETGDENEISTVALLGIMSLGEGETDTYKDAQAATADYALYAKYLEFVVKQAKPVNNEALNAAIATQYADLKANYANAEKLSAYMEELAAPYNAGVIASLGNATPESPVDITTLIVNPTIADGNKGYNGDAMTLYTDPETKTTIFERWNTNSDINQTIYALPAGTYELRGQGFYRDGGDAATSYNNWYYGAAEDVELWDTKGAILYANEAETYIRSIASEKVTDAMTKYCTAMTDQGKYDENDEVILEPEYTENTENSTSWPWDTPVSDVDDEGEPIDYFYPNSVQGSVNVWLRHPDFYWNSVKVTLTETGNITFGVKDNNDLGGDWIVMNQFKLFYLGIDPTAIATAQSKTTVSSIYNVAGTRQNTLQKGINIVKMSDGSVRKTLVK